MAHASAIIMMQSSALMVGDDYRHVQSLRYYLKLKTYCELLVAVFLNSPTTKAYVHWWLKLKSIKL
ncbi:hypothetical protein [Rickettsia endosymbiont of Gonocerus acuteangulatus]|uniref:hypothetical protein n=1 Tax=Rickettsia endosymbiont of Gonocerus acuteangulatus TaxID=3066266 RepID=UPI003132DF3E